MRRALSALSFASLIAFAPACDSSEDEVGDDFRASLDINIQMTMADGGGDDGTVIFEIVEAEVFEGPALDNKLMLYIHNNAIYDTAGIQTCTVDAPFINSNLREVIDANGSEVLFTVWNDYVFEGAIDVKLENFGQIKKVFGDQLMFQYEPYEIFLGETKDNFRLMTTNADITEQSDGRRLLMATLMTGECGGSGLPGYTF